MLEYQTRLHKNCKSNTKNNQTNNNNSNQTLYKWSYLLYAYTSFNLFLSFRPWRWRRFWKGMRQQA